MGVESTDGAHTPAQRLDDLPGPVQLVSVVGFLASLAALTQLPRLWGVEELWENVLVIGPVWSLVWFGATLVVVDRWRARRASTPPAPPARRAALRRVRLRVAWFVLRATAGIALLVLMALAIVVGEQAADEDQRLIDTAPRHRATVVDVHDDPLVRGGPTITVEVGGRTEELWLGYPGDGDAEVGDTVEVVVDPHDPEVVIPTAGHDDWVYTRAGTLTLDVGMAALALLLGVPMMRVPSPRDLVTAWRVRAVHDGEVLGRAGGVVTVDVGGDRWVWSSIDDWRPRPPHPVVVLGDVRPGGFVLVDDGRTRWPAQRWHAAPAVDPG